MVTLGWIVWIALLFTFAIHGVFWPFVVIGVWMAYRLTLGIVRGMRVEETVVEEPLPRGWAHDPRVIDVEVIEIKDRK
jgi:uncharacterized membrane protein